MAVKFYLNTKGKWGEEVAVILSVNRNYRMVKIALPVTVTRSQWDKKSQGVKGAGALETNEELRRFKMEAERLALKHPDDAELREALRAMLGRGTPQEEEAVPTILGEYARFRDMKAEEVRGSTLQIYDALEKHLRNWLKKDQPVTDVNPNWLRNFRVHLLKKGLQNSTINKLVTRAKGFLRWLEDERLIDRVPTAKALDTPQNNPIFLTASELRDLMNLDLSGQPEGYRAARELFLAGCFTGQRFSDIEAMRWEHLSHDRQWWNLAIRKRAVTRRIPIPAPLRMIIEAREGERTPLPRLSNQKLNDYIKEVCRLAGITEKVTLQRLKGPNREEKTFEKWEMIGSHSGRRTFVTLWVDDKKPLHELVGYTHDDLRVLKRYAGRSDERRQQHVDELFGGLANVSGGAANG